MTSGQTTGRWTPATFESRAPSLGYAGPLDGMRGIAILAVLLLHASYLTFGSFAGGVDVFFVVSGFLITTLLLEERRSAGAVSLRNFYLRRALRLLPLLYLTIALTVIGALVIGDRELIDTALEDALAGGLYVYHVAFPVHVDELAGRAPEIRPLIQLWSLSVEEHFYVVGVLVILVALRRRLTTPLLGAFVALIAFVATARLLGHVGPRYAWYQRPDSILVGVVAAFVNARLPTELPDRLVRLLRRGTWVALAVLAVTVWLGTAFAGPLEVHFGPPEGGSLADGLHWGEFGFTVVALTTAWITVSVVRVGDQWAARALCWGPLVAVGKRSYALYLLHVPLGVLLIEAFGDRAPALVLVLYLPLLVGATEAAHRFVERPAVRWRRRLTA